MAIFLNKGQKVIIFGPIIGEGVGNKEKQKSRGRTPFFAIKIDHDLSEWSKMELSWAC